MAGRGLAVTAAAVVGTLFALGGGVDAAPTAVGTPSRVANEVPAETTITLPLFGAPLTIDVTAAPGGAISSVTVDPADGLTASTVKPKKVKFVDEAGTGSVQVSTMHGGEKVEGRAGSLAEIVGPGGWSGDLFSTGTATTVGFEIVALDDGSPDIANVTTSDSTAVIGAVERGDGGHGGWGEHGGNGNWQQAKVRIDFTNGLQQRSLTIRASVGTRDETTQAKVSVSLSDIRGQSVPTAEAVGDHSWNGTLCDGTSASVAYTINADGTLSNVIATPATATIEAGGRGTRVTFSDHESVKLRVKSKADDTQLRVSVDEKIRCENADPTVNTPIDETIPDGGNGHHGDGGWNGGGDHDGGDHDGGDHDGNGNGGNGGGRGHGGNGGGGGGHGG